MSTTPLQGLFAALAEAPHTHDFFQTLRRIETMTPRSPRIGQAPRPALEPLRLGQDAELDFAPASLVSFNAQRHAPPRLGVRFLGLFGPQGPLPLHLTEFARERERHHADPGLARFADVFHHRVLTLFYRAWAQAQPVVHVDRPDDDQFAKWLGALFGMAPAPFRQRDSVADAAKRFQAGILSRGVKNAEGLATLLHQHLRVPVRVQPFVGHWLHLRHADRTRLGLGNAGEPSAQLGVSAVAGSKVWDRQQRFRLCIGPLSWTQYQSLLPDGTALPVVRDWVRQYVGLSRAWDVQLTLVAGEVPRARLLRHGDTRPARATNQFNTRLGLSAWLGGARRLGQWHNRSDLVLRPERMPSTRDTHFSPASTMESRHV